MKLSGESILENRRENFLSSLRLDKGREGEGGGETGIHLATVSTFARMTEKK